MKRIISILMLVALTVCIAASMVGCGDNSDSKETTSESAEASASDTTSTEKDMETAVKDSDTVAPEENSDNEGLPEKALKSYAEYSGNVRFMMKMAL